MPDETPPWSHLKGKARREAREAAIRQRHAEADAARGGPPPARPAPAGRGQGDGPEAGPRVPRGGTYAARVAAKRPAQGAPDHGSRAKVASGPGGGLPNVFPVGHGRATHPIRVVTDLVVFHQHMNVYREALEHSGLFALFEAEMKQAHGRAAMDTLWRTNLAVGFVSLAQQLLWSAENTLGEAVRVQGLNQFRGRIFRSAAITVGQYGAFSVDAMGWRVGAASTSAAVFQAVRVAAYLVPVAGNAPAIQHWERGAERFWLPTRAGCPQFREWLVIKIQGMAVAVMPGFLVSGAVIRDNLFSGRVPGWWPSVLALFPAAEAAAWDWLWQPEPDRAALVALFTGAGASAARRDRLGVTWATPSIDHFMWDMNVSAVIAAIAAQWALVEPLIDRFFFSVALAENKSEARGSHAQLSDFSDTDGINVVRSAMGLSAGAASLAAVAHPTILWDRMETGCHVVVTSDSLVGTERIHWIQRDARSVANSAPPADMETD